ncbi:heterokaryon incompatibility protein-domain-containing protein [Whalleya microplaca]|nr:heterokaryon incompatibility protein-domain-containing protein [Whalleya microplaca]
MRLLNIKKMVVESLPNRRVSEIPDYAIFSHRWGAEEVTFEEFQSGSQDIQHKKGYRKIQKCCEIASSTGFEYIWIDTCCINKENNNRELTATLAAMFKYYRDAQVCYAHLADVSGDDNPFDETSDFRQSIWFKRGWTLQELVAPLHVIFFDRDWNEIGTKANLHTVITEITEIPSQVLLMNHGGAISVEERRAWAWGRKTFEPEDEAYSLMGLLGIKIEVKYSEGREAAMKKLQDEIDKRKDISTRDPSKFSISNSVRPEPGYRLILPIHHPAPGATRIEYPEVSGPMWNITREEIGLSFHKSGNCATILFKNANGLVFAICLGVHNYNVWCGITTDCEHEDIKSISQSYWDGDKSSVRWENMDRRGVNLPNEDVASVAINKGRRDGKRAYFIDVSAEGFWPDKVGPGVFPGWWKG